MPISRWVSVPLSALNTSVADVPDCAGKRCSSRSWAFWDSMPEDGEVVLGQPPAVAAPPIRTRRERKIAAVASRGRRPASEAMDERRRSWRNTVTRLSLKINSVVFGLSVLLFCASCPVRERKKQATRLAIRDAAMALFERLHAHDVRPHRRGGRRLARDSLQLLPTRRRSSSATLRPPSMRCPRCSPSGPRASPRSAPSGRG